MKKLIMLTLMAAMVEFLFAGISRLRRISLSIILIVLFVILSSTKADNLLTNPGFESGTTGWYGYSGDSFTTSTTVYRSGSYSGYASGRTQTYQGIGQSLLGNVVNGHTYFISGWVELQNASSDSVGLTMRQMDSSGTNYIPIMWSTGNNNSWTYLSNNFTLNVSGTLTGLDLYFEGPASGVNFYVDDVYLADLTGNLLTNPGFESGTTGWYGFGGDSFTTSTTVYRNGSYSGYASGRTQTYQGIGQSLLGIMQPGKTYTITGWVKLQNTSSDSVGLTMKQTDSSGTNYISIVRSTGNNTSWTCLSNNFTLNVSGTLTGLELYFEGPASGVNFYVDDVNVSLAPWQPDANARIEQYRKGNFQITVVSPYDTNLPLSDVQVDVNQIKHQFAFGSCFNSSYLNNTIYTNFFKNHFEWAVCENQSKWYWNEPSQGNVHYTDADNIYNWCNSNGITMRGHNILWEHQPELPSWVPGLSYAPWPQTSNLYTACQNRLNSVVPHFQGKFVQWDVDNEMLGTGTDYQFFDRLEVGGPGSADVNSRVWMFQRANQLDPNCKLFMNEYAGNSWGGYDSSSYVTLANTLRSKGAPIHGIGIQGHLGQTPSFDPVSYYSSVLQPLAALNLPIWATEFDANEPNDTTRANDLENFYRICFSDPNVQGILMWGFMKGITWQSDWWLEDSNGTLNATGQRYESLMSQWTTKNSSTTDSNGNASFRGFYGKYRITLTLPEAGPTTVAIIDVLPGGPNEFTIELTNVGPPTTCQQVHDLGLTLLADLNGDCYVNYLDLKIFADNWLRNDCNESNNWCGRADLWSMDGSVNFVDFSEFALQWMQCNDPENPDCTPNW
jgi:endo-1,4-beta-xylanase